MLVLKPPVILLGLLLAPYQFEEFVRTLAGGLWELNKQEKRCSGIISKCYFNTNKEITQRPIHLLALKISAMG